jgi:magnesium-transporting ATPase (P-type)
MLPRICPTSKATRCALIVEALGLADGVQTECAFLQFADDISNKTFRQIREEYPESALVKVAVATRLVEDRSWSAQVFPFSSATKRMGTVVRVGSKFRFYLKGASEMLLPLCSTQLTSNGQQEALSAADKVRSCDVWRHIFLKRLSGANQGGHHRRICQAGAASAASGIPRL